MIPLIKSILLDLAMIITGSYIAYIGFCLVFIGIFGGKINITFR